MKNLISRLNQPFPEHRSLGRSIWIYFLVGLFISLFLIVFQPFGFDQAADSIKYIIALEFGMATFLICTIFDLLTTYIFRLQTDKPSWTLWKWILHTIVMIFFIAIGNFFLLQYLEGNQLSWPVFLRVVGSTFAIGIFPTVISGLRIQSQNVLRNREIASHFEPGTQVEEGQLIQFDSKTKDPGIELYTSKVLYLEAMDNYVNVVHEKQGGIEKVILRNTLGSFIEVLPANFFRCHRSYIVNTDKIKHVNGNAQGLVLELAQNLEVPVSRTYIPKLKNKIKYH